MQRPACRARGAPERLEFFPLTKPRCVRSTPTNGRVLPPSRMLAAYSQLICSYLAVMIPRGRSPFSFSEHARLRSVLPSPLYLCPSDERRSRRVLRGCPQPADGGSATTPPRSTLFAISAPETN